MLARHVHACLEDAREVHFMVALGTHLPLSDAALCALVGITPEERAARRAEMQQRREQMTPEQREQMRAEMRQRREQMSAERREEMRQALEAGHSTVEELLLLTTHGILHLLGFDHVEPEEEKEMFALQRRLLLTFLATR